MKIMKFVLSMILCVALLIGCSAEVAEDGEIKLTKEMIEEIEAYIDSDVEEYWIPTAIEENWVGDEDGEPVGYEVFSMKKMDDYVYRVMMNLLDADGKEVYTLHLYYFCTENEFIPEDDWFYSSKQTENGYWINAELSVAKDA